MRPRALRPEGRGGLMGRRASSASSLLGSSLACFGDVVFGDVVGFTVAFPWEP